MGPAVTPQVKRSGGGSGPVASPSSHGQGSRKRAPGRFRTRRNRNACEKGGAAQTAPFCWERSGAAPVPTPVPLNAKLTPCSLGAVRVQEKGGRQVRPCRPSRSAGAAPAALSAGRPQHQGFSPVAIETRTRRGGTQSRPSQMRGCSNRQNPRPGRGRSRTYAVPPQCRSTPRLFGDSPVPGPGGFSSLSLACPHRRRTSGASRESSPGCHSWARRRLPLSAAPLLIR